jgi:hypothetical protein
MPNVIRSFLRLALPLLLVACTGCESIGNGLNKLGQSGQNLIDYFRGNTPVAAVRKMENTSSADARWQGMNRLVRYDFGKKPPYTTRYQQIAQSDPDWFVRATAIRELNRSRDRAATPIFVKALDDANDRVRLEAAKALVNVPDEKATAPLLKIVNNPNENRDLRIAAADALKHYRTLEVARVLVNQLNERQYGVAWQARHSLKKLTRKDWYYDEAAWLAYLTKERPFG